MKRYDICVIPGDGIGPEQTDATLQVLKTVQEKYDLNIKTIIKEAGDRCKELTGSALPADTLETIKNSHTCLKGPVGETAAEVIVKLRRILDLYANIRPIKSYPNVPNLNPDVDLIIVRENTEGMYKGLEFYVDSETAITMRVITKKNSERIAKYAFELARIRKKRMRVTAVHKANVMKLSCGLFIKTCKEVAKNYPDVKLDELYVDNAAQQLIKRPHEFDIIVTTNMFGDILSDEAAILVGGLGIASGGNIGIDYAIFEPIHGSAPKYAGKEIANPSSMILATSMMFEWLGNKYVDNKLKIVSEKIEQALIDTFKEGICTRDIGGEAKTGEVGRAVADNIWKLRV